MSMEWYVVQAYSQYEAKVKQYIEERVARAGLEDFFEEILVPCETVTEVRDGKRRSSERKFYPGYVLVKMEMNEETWHLVKGTPKVSGFVGGTAGNPMPLTETEAQAILDRMNEGETSPRPKTLFEVGEHVRVIDGPFNDFSGTVEEVNYEKSRLKVSVEIFGRPTPVDLEFYQVEKN